MDPKVTRRVSKTRAIRIVRRRVLYRLGKGSEMCVWVGRKWGFRWEWVESGVRGGRMERISSIAATPRFDLVMGINKQSDYGRVYIVMVFKKGLAEDMEKRDGKLGWFEFWAILLPANHLAPNIHHNHIPFPSGMMKIQCWF